MPENSAALNSSGANTRADKKSTTDFLGAILFGFVFSKSRGGREMRQARTPPPSAAVALAVARKEGAKNYFAERASRIMIYGGGDCIGQSSGVKERR